MEKTTKYLVGALIGVSAIAIFNSYNSSKLKKENEELKKGGLTNSEDSKNLEKYRTLMPLLNSALDSFHKIMPYMDVRSNISDADYEKFSNEVNNLQPTLQKLKEFQNTLK